MTVLTGEPWSSAGRTPARFSWRVPLQHAAPPTVRPLAGRAWVPRLALLGLVLACTGKAEPAGPNQACFRALDCQVRLVCVEGRCTSDIRSLVPEGAGAAPQPEPEPEVEPDGDAG